MSVSAVLDAFREIHAALRAGAEAVVEVVELECGAFMVRWGVDGLQPLHLTYENARRLADSWDASRFLPEVCAMLREAADVAHRHSGPVH